MLSRVTNGLARCHLYSAMGKWSSFKTGMVNKHSFRQLTQSSWAQTGNMTNAGKLSDSGCIYTTKSAAMPLSTVSLSQNTRKLVSELYESPLCYPGPGVEYVAATFVSERLLSIQCPSYLNILSQKLPAGRRTPHKHPKKL